MNIRDLPQFRCCVDGYIEQLQNLVDKAEQFTEQQLTLHALCLIMEEQERTADRSPGWPSLQHRGIQAVLEDKLK